MKVIVTLW